MEGAVDEHAEYGGLENICPASHTHPFNDA